MADVQLPVKRWRKDYLSSLEDRLKTIEANLAKHERLFTFAEQHFLEGAEDTQDAEDEGLDLGSGVSLSTTELQDLPPEESPADGNDVSFLEEEDSGFFGPTSNISFLRHISRSIPVNGRIGELRTLPRNDEYSSLISASRLHSPSKGANGHHLTKFDKAFLYALPSETVSRDLIERYFSNTDLLLPFIHKESFIASYEEVKAGQFNKVTRTWLGIFNTILALASITTIRENQVQSAEERVRESDVFYQRALGLCQPHLLRGASLETVQYLLLVSQYLQATQRSVQTGTIHGLAVRSALSIGLHSSDASRKFSPIEAEMRKRTWFGCVVLDRNLSMTFGRPLAIPEDYVRIPLPVAVDSLSTSTSTEGNPASRDYASVMFFNATILLSRITSGVIVSLYGGNLGCDPPVPEKELVSRILKFEQDLDDWHRSLPSRLKLFSNPIILSKPDPDPAIQRFRLVLWLGYLNLQVLLHRPALVKYLDRRLNVVDMGYRVQTETDQLQASHIQTCLSCAEQIITIIYNTVSTVSRGVEAKSSLGPWWFSLYYAFNAALVVFGTYLAGKKYASGTLTFAPDSERCVQTVEMTIQALLKLDEGNTTVQRCADYLHQLIEPIKPSRQINHVGSELEHTGETNGGERLIESPRKGHSPLAISNLTNVSDSTLFDGLYGGDLELGQFFLPGDIAAWIHDCQVKNV